MNWTRREFLRAGLQGAGFISLGAGISPSLFCSTARAAQRENTDRVLVVLQMSGGNDGLNTLAPYRDDEYYRNRPTIGLPAGKLHKIDSDMGFHPRMEAFQRLYKEGYVSVVRGVGYPNSDRSHEGAMQIWHTADPDSGGRQTGWLGRAVDVSGEKNCMDSRMLFVGPIAQPFALNARDTVVRSVNSLDDLMIQKERENVRGKSEGDRNQDNELLSFVRQSTSRAMVNSQRIKKVAESSSNAAEYPSSRLAGHLRTIGQLIRADVGIRIFFAEMGGGGIGGFDNHANQIGNHCSLLGQLSESVDAFVKDLKRDRLLDKVLLMTFSEFGRTVKENGRHGTGHGAAAPVFLVGGKLKGGLVGTQPSLTDLDNGAPKFHTDFRQMYATVLDRWLGFDSEKVLGRRFECLDVFKA